MIPNILHGGTAIRIHESCTTIYNHDVHVTSRSTISPVYSPSMISLVFHQNNSYRSIQPHVLNATNLLIWLTKSEVLKDESRSSEYGVMNCPERARVFDCLTSNLYFHKKPLPPQPNHETSYFSIVANIEESSYTSSSGMQKGWTVITRTIKELDIDTDVRIEGMTRIKLRMDRYYLNIIFIFNILLFILFNNIHNTYFFT